MRIDLHSHSTASDGRLSPTQLVELARDRDVSTLALTDHDTLRGIAEAQAAGAQMGVRVIAGIEVSTLFNGSKEAHILGYGMRPTDEATRDTIASLQPLRASRARAILDRLALLGVPVSFDAVAALAGDGMIGRPHIARAMVAAGLVPNFQTAFDRFLAEGQPAFVPNDALTPAQAVELIHAAHGVAVLAHPCLFQGDLEALFTALIAAGLDGIEVYHPENPAAERPALLERARHNDLLITGGSDFHGLSADGDASLGSMTLPAGVVESLDAKINPVPGA
jgi:predicted metal-dependent phosphoesterase TrpH